MQVYDIVAIRDLKERLTFKIQAETPYQALQYVRNNIHSAEPHTREVLHANIEIESTEPEEDLLEWSLRRRVENAGRHRILLYVPENIERVSRGVVYRVVKNARVVRHKQHWIKGLMWACWKGDVVIGGEVVEVSGWAIVPRDRVEWVDSIPSEWQDDPGG